MNQRSPALTHLANDATPEQVLVHLQRDGAVILDDVLDAERVDRIVGELEPYVRDTAPVGDEFAGERTTRTGGLLVKSEAVRELVIDARLLAIAGAFLARFTDKIQLSLTQVIRLLPGQGAQALHRDRFIWGQGLPREVEPELNTIWALTEFTEENGATRAVPGSHLWDWERVAEPHEITQAVMRRGSVLVYSGSVIHSGGENRAQHDRIAMNINYANAWLRQEENQYLACPPEYARAFGPELQALIGYTMANYGLGYYSPPKFTPGIPDTLPPEVALQHVEALDRRRADVPEVRTF
jgi:ectoine hydroxylase-related dioxygenase (phytanoyl-CoA dioxygenase family)